MEHRKEFDQTEARAHSLTIPETKSKPEAIKDLKRSLRKMLQTGEHNGLNTVNI